MVKVSQFVPAEVRRLARNRFLIVALCALALVPMLYGSLYLFANWDPYSRFAHLPVAVVNQDRGSELQGKKFAAGDAVVAKLRGRKDFFWRFTSLPEAMRSLKHGNTYLVLVIPPDFSAHITALGKGETLAPAQVKLFTNPAKNYIGGQLSANIGKQLVMSVNQGIAEEVSGGILSRLTVLVEGINQADTALGQLADGTSKLTAGGQRLTGGLARAGNGVAKLRGGASQLVAGESALVAGLDKTTAGTKLLHEKTGEAVAGAGRLAAGAKQIAAGSGQMASKLAPAAQGLVQVENGLATVSDGSQQMAAKLGTATAGLGEVEKGLGTINTGSLQIATGIGTVAGHLREVQGKVGKFQTTIADVQAHPWKLLTMDQKKMRSDLAALHDGLGQLATGLDTAQTRLGSIESGSAKLATGTHSVRTGLETAVGKLGEMHDGTAKLGAGVHTVREGLNVAVTKLGDLGSGATELGQGATTLQDGLQAASEGLGQLYTGQTAARAGAARLKAGTLALGTGLGEFDTGLGQLQSGSLQLTAGLTRVNAGTQLLHQKLDEGTGQLAKVHLDRTNDLAAFLTQPINMKLTEVNPVPNYGTGFAPYFISLALWIGIVMACFVVKMDGRPEPRTWRSACRFVARKYLALGFVTLVQSVTLLGVLHGWLGLRAAQPWLLVAFTLVTAFTFMAVIGLLVFALGLAGRFLAVIILLLQLVTCGGTFPYELIPPILRQLAPWFPMTYSVFGMRNLIAGGESAYPAFLALIGFAALLSALAVIVVRFDWRLKGDHLSSPTPRRLVRVTEAQGRTCPHNM